MANKVVSLVVYAKKEKGWARHKAVVGDNHRIRPGWGWVNGKPQKFETFTYQLRRYEGRKAVYETIGPDPKKAKAQQADKEDEGEVVRKAAGLTGVTVVLHANRRRFADAAKEYVARTIDSGCTGDAARIYRVCYELFQEAVPEVQYVDEVNEQAMLKFKRYLRDERDNSDASVANRHRQMVTLLYWCDVEGGNPKKMAKLIGKPPKVDKKLPDVYDRDELSTLFGTVEDPTTRLYLQPRKDRCNTNDYFYTVLRILQMTGMREMEAAYLMWPDIDFKRNVIHLRSKPHMGFKLKDREERKLPIPPELLPVLHARRKVVPNARLVVGRPDDSPHFHWLVTLKRLASLAGLNCGHCEMCMSDGERYSDGHLVCGCEHWTLHGFRRTYATALDEAGFSLKQIMDLLGHADIKTTMRYLGNRRTKTMEGVKW